MVQETTKEKDRRKRRSQPKSTQHSQVSALSCWALENENLGAAGGQGTPSQGNLDCGIKLRHEVGNLVSGECIRTENNYQNEHFICASRPIFHSHVLVQCGLIVLHKLEPYGGQHITDNLLHKTLTCITTSKLHITLTQERFN